MTGIVLKLKRTVGLLSMMSILVSSVAACACSHHSAPKAESKKSCHSHSESGSDQQHGAQAAADYKSHVVSGTGCSCGQTSPRLVFKQDQKQSQLKPAMVPTTPTDPSFVAITAKPTVDNFGLESFSQSFLRSSTPSRAPPRPKSV